MRVVWLTNLQAPYREPVWTHLATKCDLDVLFLQGVESARGWRWTPRAEYSSRVLRAVRLKVLPDQGRLYVLGPCGSLWSPVPDVLVLGSWESPAYWQAFRRAQRADVAVVIFYESTKESSRFSERSLVGYARRRMLTRADVVLTGGEASSRAVASMGVSEKRIVTGFNSVDVEYFKSAASGRPARESVVPGHRYLFVGRLVGLKNVASLLEAFRTVQSPDDSLTLVGDGPMKAELLAQILDWPLDLRARVSFVGALSGDRLLAEYTRAQTLVLPSTREVWGMVINEALAAGLHVVVSRAAGVSESVRVFRGVYVCAPDAPELAVAMARSRGDFDGHILDPEILSRTPIRSAMDALGACKLAGEYRATRRGASEPPQKC